MKNFKSFGIMIDLSRNATKTLDELKRFLPIIRKMGYNTLFLYMEDTYEVEGEPYFGYMRGRYSIEELKEIDRYCDEIGMEAIPCIQTLAHLATFGRWQKVPFDHIQELLVGDERVYQLIDNMFATLSRCFKSRRIHLGMDEAHMLGRGKYLDQNGYEPKIEIMKKHLARINEIATKYGYTEPMMWSDMFFYGWNNNVYVVPKRDIPEEYKSALPKNVVPVYWDYYHDNKEQHADMLEMHLELSKKSWFAGGVWTWNGFVPDNGWSIKSMKAAIDACLEKKIKNVFMTLWGDNGAECSLYTVLPALCYIAEYAKGNTDEDAIKAKFKRIVGLDYDECIRVDSANHITGNEIGGTYPRRNPSKYMLYADTINGYLDYSVMPGASYKFAELAKDMHALSKKSRKIGYVYETIARLCDVLEIKYELGLKTRNAYLSGDKEALRRLANEDYVEVCKRIDAFGKAHRVQWNKENKFSGIETQDLRIGGLIRRMQSVRSYILEYCDGKIDRIESLDTELLPFGPKEHSTFCNNALQCISPNVM